jgi:magnesium-transporting ATPase (P-type)
LTSDNLEFLGIVLAKNTESGHQDASSNNNNNTEDNQEDEEELGPASGLSALVIGCCHELVLLEGESKGDPMEKALQRASGFGVLNADVMVQRPAYGIKLYPINRILFHMYICMYM